MVRLVELAHFVLKDLRHRGIKQEVSDRRVDWWIKIRLRVIRVCTLSRTLVRTGASSGGEAQPGRGWFEPATSLHTAGADRYASCQAGALALPCVYGGGECHASFLFCPMIPTHLKWLHVPYGRARQVRDAVSDRLPGGGGKRRGDEMPALAQ